MKDDASREHARRCHEGLERPIRRSEGNRDTDDAAEPTLRDALWLSSWLVQ